MQIDCSWLASKQASSNAVSSRFEIYIILHSNIYKQNKSKSFVYCTNKSIWWPSGVIIIFELMTGGEVILKLIISEWEIQVY